MRIQHNIAAINAHRQLGGNNTAVAKNLEKLSSGYRVNRAGDDAAGLAISEKMRAQIVSLDTAQKNANDGISLIQTAEGAMTEVHSMLNRMVELAQQSANGIYDDKTDRKNLNEEFMALQDEIDRISEATDFNGTKLLDGKLDSRLQIGDTSDEFNQLKVTVDSVSGDTLNVGKMEAAYDADGKVTNEAAIKGDTKKVSIATQDLASDAVSRVKSSINTVSSMRGKLGALQNRLEHTVNNLGATAENVTAAESRIRDVDMAKEMMAYTKNNILVQASQAMLAQANQLPQGVLQLLQ
ncbi:flagellin N-terminal helical domain-containing protein [Lacrimispora sp.]|uniref:flagellin N-terminal helical domain-containing protein n=1 Tax=Lacrimispora sp. TaxID=2719234 RepID=UPI0028A95493|nr:flagellin [Lacrimispora sp.]